MYERVRNLKTSKDCENFIRNAEERGYSDLVAEARKRATEIQAEEHGADTPAEKGALQAIYAYERVLWKKNGRKTRASRTWKMVEEHGIIEAVERAVNRKNPTQGYNALAEIGLQGCTFEAVILRHKHLFSKETVQISEERLSQWSQA